MPYIDAEKFKRKLIDEKSFFPAIVAGALKEMPTIDVMPEGTTFEEIKKIIKDAICTENDRGFAEGWTEPLCSSPEYLAEVLAKRLCNIS